MIRDVQTTKRAMKSLGKAPPLILIALVWSVQSACAPHHKSSHLNSIRQPASETGESEPSEFKKFKRALVLEGMNFNAAISVGIFDGFTDWGMPPDLVISSCGASIANAILNAYPNREERLKFLFSEEFFSILKEVRQRDPKLSSALGITVSKLAGMNSRRFSRKFGLDTIPPLFEGYLLEVGTLKSGRLAKKHFSTNDPIRSVVLGGLLEFGPQDVGSPRANRRLYREVFFTDSEIAERLKGFISPIAISFPESAVQLKTSADSGLTVGDAMRVSVSDPYLMKPIQINGRYYVAGTVDLYPIEVAYHLADEVAAVFPSPFDFIERSVVEASFGVNFNTRLQQYTGMYARTWIDCSDFSEIESDLFGGVHLKPLKNELAVRLPESVDDFVRMVKSQWALGYRRGVEAARQLPNSRAHVRGMKSLNASSTTRNEVERQRTYFGIPDWAKPFVE